MLDFYGNAAEACFEMNADFDPKKIHIDSLEELIKYREGPTTSDFGISTEEGFYDFQIKRYRGAMATEELFNFVEERIHHYCNDLGTTNLIVLLQPQTDDSANIDFHDINNRLLGLKFRSEAQVLIAHNEMNEHFVLNQVHPKLTRSEIPIRDSVKSLYETRKNET